MSFKNCLRYIVVVIMLAWSSPAYAQLDKWSVAFSPIVIAHTGRSYGLSVQYDVTKKIRVYLGGKFHQNLLMDPVFNSRKFRYRFHANSLGQHIGCSLGANYFFNWKYSVLKPYAYYDFTYYRMDTRSLVFQTIDSSVNGTSTKLHVVTPLKYYNLNTFENNIGLGFECPLTKWLSLNMRGGVGANFISNLPKSQYAGGKHTELSLQYLLAFQFNL